MNIGSGITPNMQASSRQAPISSASHKDITFTTPCDHLGDYRSAQTSHKQYVGDMLKESFRRDAASVEGFLIKFQSQILKNGQTDQLTRCAFNLLIDENSKQVVSGEGIKTLLQWLNTNWSHIKQQTRQDRLSVMTAEHLPVLVDALSTKDFVELAQHHKNLFSPEDIMAFCARQSGRYENIRELEGFKVLDTASVLKKTWEIGFNIDQPRQFKTQFGEYLNKLSSSDLFRNETDFNTREGIFKPKGRHDLYLNEEKYTLTEQALKDLLPKKTFLESIGWREPANYSRRVDDGKIVKTKSLSRVKQPFQRV